MIGMNPTLIFARSKSVIVVRTPQTRKAPRSAGKAAGRSGRHCPNDRPSLVRVLNFVKTRHWVRYVGGSMKHAKRVDGVTPLNSNVFCGGSESRKTHRADARMCSVVARQASPAHAVQPKTCHPERSEGPLLWP